MSIYTFANSKITKCSKEIIGRYLTSKLPIFKGINLRLKYEPSGKTFELPRFFSPEMRQAREMNKITIRQIKNKTPKTYPKAQAQDLKQLTSQTIEDSYSRVEWTNPKDGKIYNILKTGETKDGKILVRILDKEGEFLKEAELTPKTIAIPDDFENGSYFFGLPHGEIVKTFAKRNNPFAKYITFNINKQQIANCTDLDEAFKYLEDGGKIDYLSCSYGTNIPGKKKIIPNSPQIKKALEEVQYHDKAANKGIRVLCAGNNADEKTLNETRNLSNGLLIINSKVEGVGSLNPKTGKISDFSLSRNSNLTQHYEIGEYTPVLTKEGLNITGIFGTDLKCPTIALEKFTQNPLLGKSQKRVQSLIKTIDDRIKDLEKESVALFTSKKPFKEIIKEKTEIEAKKHLYQRRRIKIFEYLNGLTAQNGIYQLPLKKLTGTSLSTPIRAAKLALNDMMEGII